MINEEIIDDDILIMIILDEEEHRKSLMEKLLTTKQKNILRSTKFFQSNFFSRAFFDAMFPFKILSHLQ